MDKFKVGDKVMFPSPMSYNYREPVSGVVVDVSPFTGCIEVKPAAGGLTGMYRAAELTKEGT